MSAIPTMIKVEIEQYASRSLNGYVFLREIEQIHRRRKNNSTSTTFGPKSATTVLDYTLCLQRPTGLKYEIFAQKDLPLADVGTISKWELRESGIAGHHDNDKSATKSAVRATA